MCKCVRVTLKKLHEKLTTIKETFINCLIQMRCILRNWSWHIQRAGICYVYLEILKQKCK